MSATQGYKCKMYRNSGTWALPAWNEIAAVRDVTLNRERSESDVSTRGGGEFKQALAGQIDASVEFEMVYNPQDADMDTIETAFQNNSTIELAVMNGNINTAGSEGLHADFVVLSAPRNEPLQEGVTVQYTLKPAYSSNAAEWMTVAS